MGIKQKNVAYPPGAIVGGPTYVKVGISKNPKGRMPNVERALKKGIGLPFLPDGEYEWEPMQLIGYSVPTPHAEEIERVFQKDFNWFFNYNNQTHDFIDGMIITEGGVV